MLALFSFVSCNNEIELAKMIPADRVELEGDDSDLFEIDDSVKVLLIPVGTDGKKWEVRAHLPLRNTTPWSEIPGSDQSLDHYISGVLFYPQYLDENDTELDLSVETDYQDGEKLLKSDELITKDIAIKEYNFGDKSYKKQKAYFDLIDGIELTVKLSWAHTVSSSSSSYDSSSSSKSSSKDWNELLDTYEKYVNECVKLIKKEDRGEYVSEGKIDDLIDKIDNLETILDKGVDGMSDAQYKRYMKIGDKLDDAIF